MVIRSTGLTVGQMCATNRITSVSFASTMTHGFLMGIVGGIPLNERRSPHSPRSNAYSDWSLRCQPRHLSIN